tara:strand:+ start:184 stop:771 length:588 start_codon:yes stop_codon:yes gene_type:complete
MVKLNEALFVGISLLAALVFSKGRGSAPSLPSLPFNNPYTDLLGKAQVQVIKKGQSNIETLQNIQKEILDYEENITNTKIDYLQNELSKTQSFISQQQKIAFPPQLKIGNKGILSREISSNIVRLGGFWNYYDSVAKGQTTIKKEYIDNLQEAAEMKIAENKIEKANKLIFAQQSEISRLQEEYDSRFGSLSRYG